MAIFRIEITALQVEITVSVESVWNEKGILQRGWVSKPEPSGTWTEKEIVPDTWTEKEIT